LHYIVSFSNEAYGQATSINKIKEHLGTKPGDSKPPYKVPIPEEYYVHKNNTSADGRRANAAIVMLGRYSMVMSGEKWPLIYFYVARNGDLNGVMSSMKQLEDRFNKKFNYPYVFLNEEPFSEDFIACALFMYTVQLSTHAIPLQPYIRGHRF